MSQSIDAKLDALNLLLSADELNRYLSDRNARVVGKAATQAAEQLHYELLEPLAAAFQRLCEDGSKRDPQCLGKNKICKALLELDCRDIPLLLQGMRYEQMEPVWGGRQDSAQEIRVHCASALVATGWHRALMEVCPLLYDPEVPVRVGAAKAISSGNPTQAELMLRQKVFSGDKEAEVLGGCFEALLEVEPDESLSFVANFLYQRDEAVQEHAILALAFSKLDGVLPLLQKLWHQQLSFNHTRRMIIKAACWLRGSEGIDWLLTLLPGCHNTMADYVLYQLQDNSANEQLLVIARQAARSGVN